MIARQFDHLINIAGNPLFARKVNKTHGVYFWGVTLREDFGLPQNENEMVIFYIGKDKEDVIERIMQELTQLVFGGFGPIFDIKHLIKNPFTARLKHEQILRNPASNYPIIYDSDGLHVLHNFLTDSNIKNTIDWMRDRIIFTWIDYIDQKDLSNVESEFHHIVRTNCMGTKMKNLGPKKDITIPKQTPFFHTPGLWNFNPILKKWLEETNKRI